MKSYFPTRGSNVIIVWHLGLYFSVYLGVGIFYDHNKTVQSICDVFCGPYNYLYRYIATPMHMVRYYLLNRSGFHFHFHFYIFILFHLILNLAVLLIYFGIFEGGGSVMKQ